MNRTGFMRVNNYHEVVIDDCCNCGSSKKDADEFDPKMNGGFLYKYYCHAMAAVGVKDFEVSPGMVCDKWHRY